jgi:eukaryotic-like serine/threonine-protein kinase
VGGASQPSQTVRFDSFEVDLRSGELHKNGTKIRLPEQSFRILAMLLERPGDIVSRNEIEEQLWPNDTVVEFENSINSAVKKLRHALGDSADQPRFIETLARRGYRWLIPIERAEPKTFDRQPQGALTASSAEPLAHHLIGRKISHYRVLEVLGGGGMGVVYRAEDLKLGRSVALKFLPDELMDDSASTERLEREARAASALNHPNICTIYEVDQYEGLPFIVMELLEGQTLRELIPSSGIVDYGVQQPFAKLLDIAIQIAHALEAAHNQDIIHGDIKPANIFVTTQGRVKILDFGLAKVPGSESTRLEAKAITSSDVKQHSNVGLTHTGATIGTAGYMSPEQVRGEKLDARTDLFSFGLVLYEMASGQRAFNGETAHLIEAAIIQDTPTPLRRLNSALPSTLDTIIQRALEKNREARYQSSAEMRADLERLRASCEKTRPAIRTLAAAAAALLLTLAILLMLRLSIKAPRTDMRSAPEPSLLPLISLPGEEVMPALSPDGTRVAFVWHSPDHNKSGIYVSVVGTQDLTRLTRSEDDYSPTWSPDGRHVAFQHDLGNKFSVQLVPSVEGPQKPIFTGLVGAFGLHAQNGMSFSPDGKWLAFAEWTSTTSPDSISLLSLENSSTSVLTSPPFGFHDARPAFSPDGEKVAFIRSSGPIFVNELFVMPVAGGKPKQLTFDRKRIFGPPTWTEDSREIVYASNRSGLTALWRIAANGGSPQPVRGAGPVAWYPSISNHGKKLVYEQPEVEQNLWRLRLQDDIHGLGSASLLVSSANSGNFLPQFSPDGSKIAFTSDRGGYTQVWMCDSDGSNPVQVTHLQSLAGSPSWSPNGRYLAIDYRPREHSEIYVVEIASHRQTSLASSPDADNVVPRWSRDGNWIYFASNRESNTFQIWRVAVKEGSAIGGPIQVTRNGGFAAAESWDGLRLFYTKQSDPGIWTVAPDGGRETALWNGPGPDNWSNMTVGRNGIYFLVPNPTVPPEIEFLNLRTGRISRVASLQKTSFYGLAASPDHKSVIYSQLDRDKYQILVLANFR